MSLAYRTRVGLENSVLFVLSAIFPIEIRVEEKKRQSVSMLEILPCWE